MTSIWATIDPATEIRNGLLVKNPIWKTDFVCERQLRALNMSKKTKQVKVIVVSRGVTILSLSWKHETEKKKRKKDN